MVLLRDRGVGVTLAREDQEEFGVLHLLEVILG